ncbi:MAG: flagellin lysine-N-methylase [Clostridia bacterium]|nr:flagellin lysine-N-methylase [Clostridia bacterium]
MEVFVPRYYKDFKCIAKDCAHSCCIGWQIEIDSKTQEKYANLKGDYADAIRRSLTKKNPPHFKLVKGKRCPHLNNDGLCKIIIDYGEEYLCDICREHPRFYNRTARGLEVGLGISCPTACKLVLTTDGYADFVKTADVDYFEELPPYDCSNALDKIFKIIGDRQTTLSDRIEEIERTFLVSPKEQTDERWKKIINSLEYLNEDHRALFLNYSNLSVCPKNLETFCERAFAYFAYRHLPTAQNPDEFRKTLGFCLFLLRLLISSIINACVTDIDGTVSLAVTISEEIEYSLDNQEQILSAFTKL